MMKFRNKYILSIFIYILSLNSLIAAEINIYSHRQPFLINPFLEAFTQETGIKTNVVYATKGLAQRLRAEGKNSPADLILTVDIGRLYIYEDLDLLSEVSSPILDENIPKHLKSERNTWFALSKRSRIIATSKERLKKDDILRIEDLADPKWKGKLCLRTSKKVYNRSLIASMIDTYGFEKTKAVVSGWVANLATEVFSNDTNALKAVSSGQCGMTIVNTYYLARLLDDPKYNNLTLFWANQNDRGVHVNISGAGIVKTSKNKDDAALLLEYLSSEKAQDFYASANKEYPVLEGAMVHKSIKEWGEFSEDTINVSKLGSLQKEAVFLAQEVGYK